MKDTFVSHHREKADAVHKDDIKANTQKSLIVSKCGGKKTVIDTTYT